MDWLTLIVDGLWIGALAVMSSVSRLAYRRILPTAKVPIQLDLKGALTWRAPRLVAVTFAPVIACAVWLILVAASQLAPVEPSEKAILLGLRLFIAPVFCLAHLWQMRRALSVLGAEGQLRS